MGNTPVVKTKRNGQNEGPQPQHRGDAKALDDSPGVEVPYMTKNILDDDPVLRSVLTKMQRRMAVAIHQRSMYSVDHTDNLRQYTVEVTTDNHQNIGRTSPRLFYNDALQEDSIEQYDLVQSGTNMSPPRFKQQSSVVQQQDDKTIATRESIGKWLRRSSETATATTPPPPPQETSTSNRAGTLLRSLSRHFKCQPQPRCGYMDHRKQQAEDSIADESSTLIEKQGNESSISQTNNKSMLIKKEDDKTVATVDSDSFGAWLGAPAVEEESTTAAVPPSTQKETQQHKKPGILERLEHVEHYFSQYFKCQPKPVTVGCFMDRRRALMEEHDNMTTRGHDDDHNSIREEDDHLENESIVSVINALDEVLESYINGCHIGCQPLENNNFQKDVSIDEISSFTDGDEDQKKNSLLGLTVEEAQAQIVEAQEQIVEGGMNVLEKLQSIPSQSDLMKRAERMTNYQPSFIEDANDGTNSYSSASYSTLSSYDNNNNNNADDDTKEKETGGSKRTFEIQLARDLLTSFAQSHNMTLDDVVDLLKEDDTIDASVVESLAKELD